MFERLSRLYQEGKIDEVGLMNAIKRGWITKEQAQEIISSTL